MGKTQFHKDQLVDFRISADGPWIRGARYLHLVPGPESGGPDARVRVRAVSSLHFTPLLSDVRPMAYVTPAWLKERNNDPFGTPGRHPFWESQPAEQVGVWKLFQRDGWWFGYKTTQNAWAHFRTEAEAREHASGPQVDIWA